MLFKKIMAVVCAAMLAVPAANAADYDTSDPLYMNGRSEILSTSNIAYYDSVLRIGQALSYGFTERFNAGISLHTRMILTATRTVSPALTWAENIV